MTPNDQYQRVLEILNMLGKKLKNIKKEILRVENTFQQNLISIEHKKIELLEENNQHITKVNAFIGIAKAHASSLCESVIPYTFDNGKLARLAVQINNASHNDKFAEQRYFEATGQLKYLENYVSEINAVCDEKIKSIKYEYNIQRNSQNNKLEKLISTAHEFFFSQEIKLLLELLNKDYYLYQDDTDIEPTIQPAYISLGTMKVAFPIIDGCESVANKAFSNFYDSYDNTIGLPYSIRIDDCAVFSIEYINSLEDTLIKGIQNYILNILKYCSGKYKQICFFDPIRYNDGSLGCLGRIADDRGAIIDRVPLSQDENGFIQCSGKKILLIFHNFPQSYDSTVVSQIQQLCVNAERYNLSVIVTHNNSSKNLVLSEVFSYIQSIAQRIECIQEKFFIRDNRGENREFKWYQSPEVLPEYIRKKFIEERPIVDKSNNYKKRVGFVKSLVIKKGERKIENIPFGVDSQGKLQYLDFENSNFATFICGASRSGKSTLLHTILTGIMQQTHPDDVEIWLIDFKMTEFSRYIDHLPPHVRYILLDESPELVYDIIDRLTEILIKRQNIFKGKWQKLDEVPKDKYMPALFVVIDEFSVMSQIVADSISTGDNYVVKMQSLLAKGAALGMHFIFASQGFTSGTRGLNDFSKKQIQQRLAMKTEFNEIKETLDLKSASDGDRAMMEQLPVYHALVRIPVDIQGNHLALVKSLYIEDYSEQEKLIDEMNKKYSPERKYDVNNGYSFIYKKPMIIDGNKYSSFYEHSKEIKEKIKSMDLYDEIALFTGEPRRMLPQYPIIINNGFCENILMVASSGENGPAASVVLSAMESLKIQNKEFEIWGTNKNGLYRNVKHMRRGISSISLELEQVCSRIKSVKDDIQNKKEDNKIIFLFGFETLMLDMSYQPKNAEVNTKRTKSSSLNIERREEGEMDLNMLLASLTGGGTTGVSVIKKEQEKMSVLENKKDVSCGAYDARDDLKYIFTHGPRQGYHFFIAFNSAGEMMQCKIDASLFKHKVLFRMPKTDAMNIIGSSGSNIISELADHSYRYSNGLEAVSFRPYLHEYLSWDGWKVENGQAINIVDEEEEYLL